MNPPPPPVHSYHKNISHEKKNNEGLTEQRMMILLPLEHIMSSRKSSEGTAIISRVIYYMNKSQTKLQLIRNVSSKVIYWNNNTTFGILAFVIISQQINLLSLSNN